MITFEGGEGAGKSTQVAALARVMVASGLPVVRSREPGGTPGAEAIRDLLLQGSGDRWSSITEALLHTAARSEHAERWIRPHLASGHYVLIDRFVDSTRVYQGIAGGLGIGRVDQLHRLAVGDLEPDLTILLDLPADLGLERAKATRGEDRYERMGRDYHARVRDGFLALAAAASGRFRVIDATRPPATVAGDVLRAVGERFHLDLRRGP